MYSILLVDDEWTVREGLKQTVPWHEVGCHVIGDATDGYEGLRLFEELKPDIVITDIRMPNLDGLALAERILASSGDSKVILLTGFDEFSYAQAAVQMGVTGYVLKPTDINELLQVVKRATEQLDVARAHSAAARRLNEQLAMSKRLALEKIVIDIMFSPGKENQVDLLRTLGGDGLQSVFQSFQVLLVEWSPTNRSTETAGLFECFEKDLHVIGGADNWVLPLQDSRLAIILPQPLSSDELDQLDSRLRELAAVGMPVSVGLSGIHSDVSTLFRAAFEAELALQQKETIGIGRIVQFKTLGWTGTLRGHDIAAIEQYVKAHFHCDISLQGLAAMFHVSESHLSRLFKQYTGVHFSDYVARHRVQLAQKLLLVPGAKVYEVARAVGYVDPRYFSQVFRRQTGLTPREYRRRKGAGSP